MQLPKPLVVVKYGVDTLKNEVDAALHTICRIGVYTLKNEGRCSMNFIYI